MHSRYHGSSHRSASPMGYGSLYTPTQQFIVFAWNRECWPFGRTSSESWGSVVPSPPIHSQNEPRSVVHRPSAEPVVTLGPVSEFASQVRVVIIP